MSERKMPGDKKDISEYSSPFWQNPEGRDICTDDKVTKELLENILDDIKKDDAEFPVPIIDRKSILLNLLTPLRK